MAKKYNDARAVKQTKSSAASEVTVDKKTIKKIKKSPILIVAILFLAIGAVAGFFAAKNLTYFRFASFSVNGVKAEENDYVEIDVTELKATLSAAGKPNEFADMNALIKSDGVEISFFGASLKDKVKRVLYYREDKSHDVVAADNIDLEKAGIYYEEYTVDHFAFKNSKLIRTIVVTGVENNG